jgi:IclR family mhp operon transcriptional activator
MAPRNTVRSLTRGLAVLEALSQLKFSDPTTLAAATGVPRPTIYRLLETLAAAGYVQQVEHTNLFQLTGALRAIARGFDMDAEVSAIAGPALSMLSRKLTWPVDLSTYENDCMVVRVSTHAASPKSLIGRADVGHRLPMLLTAPGLAFLAYSPESKCAEIVARCLPLSVSDATCADGEGLIQRKLLDIRRRGYAFRIGGKMPTTSSFAVPVMWRGWAVAAISVMFIRSAVTIREMVKLYLADVEAVARSVERQLAEATATDAVA